MDDIKVTHYCDQGHYRHDPNGDCPECEMEHNHRRKPNEYPVPTDLGICPTTDVCTLCYLSYMNA